MNFKSILSLVLFVGMTFSVSAQKFGYVNTQELLSQLPEVKEANANIENLKTQLQKKGQNMITALQTKYQDLEKRQNELSPKQLEIEANAIRQEEQKIGEFEQSSQQKIIMKSEELLKPIQERVQVAIDNVAKEKGYTYIFDASMGLILYADPSTEVTALVKAKLGL
jgi:outer membrane protein